MVVLIRVDELRSPDTGEVFVGYENKLMHIMCVKP
jgi:hypothetical protein